MKTNDIPHFAAIDFGTSKIVTAVVQGGGISRCKIVGSGTVPYSGFSDGFWNDPDYVLEAVRESIAAAEYEANTKIREIYVGVPGAFVHVLTGEAEYVRPAQGDITDDDVNAVQDMVADKLHIGEDGGYVLHRSPAWYSIDDGKTLMNPVGYTGTRLRARISFVVADPEFIDDARAFIGPLGIDIVGFLSPTLGQGLLLLAPEERDRVAAIIDVGYLNTEVSVIEGDAIVYHAILPEGSGFITGDLMQKLRLTMDEAEQVKRAYLFNPDEFDQDDFYEAFDDNGRRITLPRNAVSKVVEHQVDQLCDALDRTFKDDAMRFFGPRSQVYLTGGGITLMRGGREYLAGKLGRPVKVLVAKAERLNTPVYSSITGLISLILDSTEKQESEQKPRRKFGKIAGMLRR